MRNFSTPSAAESPDHLVKIVIPIYRQQLTDYEYSSLQNNVAVLARYPIALLAPDGLDISAIARCVGEPEVVRVPADWLGERCGIEGYNRMMLSADFYRLFRDYTYILICQTDAWVFRDELAAWCRREYDYVGAPWVKRPRYSYFPLNIYFLLRKQYHIVRQRLMCRGEFAAPTRYERFGRVGNGGLSLRRVDSFIKACNAYPCEIEFFNSHNQMTCNEDWFWALIPSEFSRPDVAEALQFAIDDYPKRCLKLNGGELPFGCHGWSKRRNFDFWKDIIVPHSRPSSR